MNTLFDKWAQAILDNAQNEKERRMEIESLGQAVYGIIHEGKGTPAQRRALCRIVSTLGPVTPPPNYGIKLLRSLTDQVTRGQGVSTSQAVNRILTVES